MINDIPSITPRTRRRAKNLEMILDKAMDLVILNGWEGFFGASLGPGSGLHAGGLYRYFDSKDEIFSALVVRILRIFAQQQQAHLNLSTDGGVTPIVLAAGSYKAFALQAPHRFGLLAMMMADPKELLLSDKSAQPVVEAMLETLKPLRTVIENATAEGLLSPGNASQRTLTLFASLQGVLQLRKLGERVPHIFDVNALFDNLIRSTLMGWGVTWEDLQKAEAATSVLEPLPTPWSTQR